MARLRIEFQHLLLCWIERLDLAVGDPSQTASALTIYAPRVCAGHSTESVLEKLGQLRAASRVTLRAMHPVVAPSVEVVLISSFFSGRCGVAGLRLAANARAANAGTLIEFTGTQSIAGFDELPPVRAAIGVIELAGALAGGHLARSIEGLACQSVTHHGAGIVVTPAMSDLSLELLLRRFRGGLALLARLGAGRQAGECSDGCDARVRDRHHISV